MLVLDTKGRDKVRGVLTKFLAAHSHSETPSSGGNEAVKALSAVFTNSELVAHVEDAAILEALLREKQAKTAMENIWRAVISKKLVFHSPHGFTPAEVAEKAENLLELWTLPITLVHDISFLYLIKI
jgi:hypothetical protein